MSETSCLSSVLGDNLLSGHNGEVKTSSLASKSRYVMIYFSAHWCSPCRRFTPELSTYYRTYKDVFNFEIIFVSSDKDSSSWRKYWNEMPWLAIAYQKRDIRDYLSKKFQVTGIPTLVVLDNQGNTITTKAREKVSSDPTGFPWMPKTFFDIFNGEVRNSGGNKISLETLKESKSIVGIYFSAHWCPPCRTFTPQLVKTYELLKERSTNFEVIFASSDRTEVDYQRYLGEMPWFAFPFKDARVNEFGELYEIESLPTLVIVDASTGKVITDEGRTALIGDPQGIEFPWAPKSANPVDSAGKVLDRHICFLYFDSQLSIQQKTALINVAEEFLSKSPVSTVGDNLPLKFFFGSNGGLADQIREFTALDYDPITIILNIKHNLMYVLPGQITTENEFRQILLRFSEGKLTPQSIKE